MAIVYVDSFLGRTEDDREVDAWLSGILQNQKCLVCGEKVFRRKAFIWWMADSNIILCEECAEHTICGLSRDLVELKGDKTAKGKPSERYGPVVLKREIENLRHKTLVYLKQILELQNLLAREK